MTGMGSQNLRRWAPGLAAAALVAGGLLFGAIAGGPRDVQGGVHAAARTPVCDSACLATKSAVDRALFASHGKVRPPEPPLPATVPAGIPVDTSVPPGVPWDACRSILMGEYVVPTVIQLVKEHGRPLGCGAYYYLANGTPCIERVLIGPLKCSASPAPDRLVVIEAPGAASGNPQPGFLTCNRPYGAPTDACGVDDVIGVSARAKTDRSAAWMFTPYPEGAHLIPEPPFVTPPTPSPPGQPQELCVGNGQAMWAFHAATHSYSSGCPYPWS